MKTCTICLKEKDDTEFRSRRANCKSCDVARHRLWARSNTEHLREYNRGRYRKHQDRWKDHIMRKYNITPDVYENMLRQQHYCCAICHTHTPGGNTKRFSIDHCHSTGKIRGLLCVRCNNMLGLSRDSADILTAGSDYLIESRAK